MIMISRDQEGKMIKHSKLLADQILPFPCTNIGLLGVVGHPNHINH